jgi:hypothetical protein
MFIPKQTGGLEDWKAGGLGNRPSTPPTLQLSNPLV